MTVTRFAVLACLLAAFAAPAAAQQDLRATLFAEADRALAEARAANAELLAPATFARGAEAYAGAESDLARGRNMDRIRSALTNAARGLHRGRRRRRDRERHARRRHQDARRRDQCQRRDVRGRSLGRSRARASTRRRAGSKTGDIRGARGRADEAEALYRDAELTAIKAQYLSQTRALLAEAEQARVPRLAPRTYEKARSLLAEAERELSENRYDTDLPRSLAQQANYEARHAIYLAALIDRLRERRPIARGPDPELRAAATPTSAPQPTRPRSSTRASSPSSPSSSPTSKGCASRPRKPSAISSDTRTRVGELEEEIRDLDQRLGGVSQERVALVQRLEAEARIREQFAAIENMFARDEARVSREGNRMVIRLVGLTFQSGQDVVRPAYRPLLDKLRQAAEVFPRSQITVEGHTDSYGGDENNLALSRRRAEAVSAFLTTELNVPEFRLSSVGYGETQPIANNDTEQGRERNRRIDVIIEPQLESAPSTP